MRRHVASEWEISYFSDFFSWKGPFGCLQIVVWVATSITANESIVIQVVIQVVATCFTAFESSLVIGN